MVDGTSLAAPIVAGMVAMKMGRNPNLSYTEVIDSLLDTTAKTAGAAGLSKSSGIADLDAFLAAPDSSGKGPDTSWPKDNSPKDNKPPRGWSGAQTPQLNLWLLYLLILSGAVI
eukprot:GHVN01021671.1.p1 GENE.GHVN01021671.1~~GHVN01021671.1.p1  ORF type:complete len:114 (+),score=16.56 GHVN01021671.1:606-947(+)